MSTPMYAHIWSKFGEAVVMIDFIGKQSHTPSDILVHTPYINMKLLPAQLCVDFKLGLALVIMNNIV